MNGTDRLAVVKPTERLYQRDFDTPADTYRNPSGNTDRDILRPS